eukprot:2590479-Alexandrium_andersonii.AAC.1
MLTRGSAVMSWSLLWGGGLRASPRICGSSPASHVALPSPPPSPHAPPRRQAAGAQRAGEPFPFHSQ